MNEDEQPLVRCDLKSPSRSPRMKHSLTSDPNEKRMCLSNVDQRNSCGDQQTNKKYIQAYHTFKLEIRLQNILWLKVPPKFRFRFHQSRYTKSNL